MRMYEIRKKKHIKVKDIASQLHVSYQTISNWEHGRTEPDIKSLIALARILGVSVDYLIGNDDTSYETSYLNQKIDRMSKEQLKEKIQAYIKILNDIE